MALNRDERIRMLGALLERDQPKFAHLVQDSPNITKETKIELLTELVTLTYGDDMDAITRLRKILASDDASA